MTFKDFLDKIDKAYYENEFEMRYGQVIMNVLYDVWKEKYIQITTEQTDYDCFYDDGIVRFTLEKLEKEWNDQ